MLETNQSDRLTTLPPMVSKHKTKSLNNKWILKTITTRNYPIRQTVSLRQCSTEDAIQSVIPQRSNSIPVNQNNHTPPPKDTVSYLKLHACLCDVPTFLNNKFHDLSIASGKLCPSLYLLRTTRRRTRRSSVMSREGVCPADWRCQQLCIERTMLCSLEQSAVMPRTISRRRKIRHQISDHAGRSVVTPWKRTVPSRLG